MAAKRVGTTSHNFNLEAIAEQAEQAELRVDFDTLAEQRYARIAESGQTIPWDEMRAYLKERAEGKVAILSATRKLAELAWRASNWRRRRARISFWPFAASEKPVLPGQ